MLHLTTVDHQIGVAFAPPTAALGIDMQDVADIMAPSLDIEQRMQSVGGVGTVPAGVEPARVLGVLPACHAVEVIGHVADVGFVAVVIQDHARAFRERHRQIALVTVVVDREIERFVVDGLATYGAEEIGRRDIDARVVVAIPIDAQNQVAVLDAAPSVGEVEIGDDARAVETGKFVFLSGSYFDPAPIAAGLAHSGLQGRNVVRKLCCCRYGKNQG